MSCRLASKFFTTGTFNLAMSVTKEKVTTCRASDMGLGTDEATDATTDEEKNRAKKASSKQRNAGT
jgi:hypothetical protein